MLLKKVLLIEQFNKNDLFEFEKSNFALSKISNLNYIHSDFVLIKFQEFKLLLTKLAFIKVELLKLLLENLLNLQMLIEYLEMFMIIKV